MQTAANTLEDKVLRDVPISTTNEPRLSSSKKMKALKWYGNKDVRLEEAPVPLITEPTDAIIKVTGSTICGSDLHLYHSEILELKKGDILGHEYMGVVESVGNGVKDIKPGDRVVASFQIACGECSYCKRGLTSMCDTTNSSALQEQLYGTKFAGMNGYAHFTGGFSGGQAEYVRAPFADFNLLKIPDSVPDEKALYLSDIVPTSYHAVEYTGVEKGDVVGVWGLGPIGLLVAKWCQIKGASRVIGIDNVEARLSFAREKLGIEVVDFSKIDTVKGVKELVPEGLDVAIDCAAFRYAKSLLHKIERAVALETDSPENINEAILCVKKFGKIGLIADYAAYANHFNIGGIMETGIKLTGCGQAPVGKYWKGLLKQIESGEFDPTIILSHRIDLDEFVELYKVFDEKREDMLKVFVQTKFSGPRAKGTPELTSLKGLV